jgi:hypothetical protein
MRDTCDELLKKVYYPPSSWLHVVRYPCDTRLVSRQFGDLAAYLPVPDHSQSNNASTLRLVSPWL